MDDSTTITLDTASFNVSTLDLPIKGQDRMLIRQGFAGIADGATPVAPCPQDVGLFAEAALQAIADHEMVSLPQAVRCAIREVGYPTEDPVATPSAAIVVAQARAGRLEIGVLGDCLAIVALRDGAILVASRDPRLLEIDRQKDAVIAQVLASGLGFLVAREQIRPLIRAQRSEMNQVGGYWIFAASPVAADHLLETGAPLDAVEAILLCSDGFSRLWDGLGVYVGPAELLEGARSVGLAELGRILRATEAGDDPPSRMPRVSSRDDASAVLLERIA